MRRLITKGILRVFASFIKSEVVPRASEILWTQDAVIAVIVGLLVGYKADVITGAPKSADIAIGFLAYAAIALAFCVAGITISLTLPDRDFLERLAGMTIEEKQGNALSSLLFVFTWTGFVHWICVVALLCVLLLDGGNTNPFTKNAVGTRLIWIMFTTTICAYALESFLITLLTISKVGKLFIEKIRTK